MRNSLPKTTTASSLAEEYMFIVEHVYLTFCEEGNGQSNTHHLSILKILKAQFSVNISFIGFTTCAWRMHLSQI